MIISLSRDFSTQYYLLGSGGGDDLEIAVMGFLHLSKIFCCAFNKRENGIAHF